MPLCPDCKRAHDGWLDFKPPSYMRRWKGQCCLTRADDYGNGACPRCRMNLEMHQQKHREFIQAQLRTIRRICESEHQ